MAADIKAYCLSGEGRGVLPETLVDAEIASGRLSIIRVDTNMLIRSHSIVLRRPAFRPSAFGELLRISWVTAGHRIRIMCGM